MMSGEWLIKLYDYINFFEKPRTEMLGSIFEAHVTKKLMIAFKSLEWNWKQTRMAQSQFLKVIISFTIIIM